MAHDGAGKWEIVAAVSEKRKKVFRVLVELPNDVVKSAFTECVVIEWVFGGDLPGPATGRLLQQFENHLAALDDHAHNSLQLMVITGNGKREWVYYAKNYPAFMVSLNAALAKQPRFPITIEHSADADWVYWTKILDYVRAERQGHPGVASTSDAIVKDLMESADEHVLAAKIAACEGLAKRLAASAFKLMNPPMIDYAVADSRQFMHLDLSFYARVTAELQACGFNRSIDAEPLHHARSKGNRVLMRFLMSDNEPLCVALFAIHPAPPGIVGRVINWLAGKKLVHRHGMIEFETEFSNGEFVTTNTSLGKSPFSAPPEIHTQQMPGDTPARQMLEAHRGRVAKYKRDHVGVRERIVADLDEITTQEQRVRALKINHRRTIGGISREELKDLAKDKFPYVEENVMKEMSRLIAQASNAPLQQSPFDAQLAPARQRESI